MYTNRRFVYRIQSDRLSPLSESTFWCIFCNNNWREIFFLKWRILFHKFHKFWYQNVFFKRAEAKDETCRYCCGKYTLVLLFFCTQTTRSGYLLDSALLTVRSYMSKSMNEYHAGSFARRTFHVPNWMQVNLSKDIRFVTWKVWRLKQAWLGLVVYNR